jgi:N utilization substance protein B
MINRVLIRLKIIQITYAYYQNGSKNIDAAEKELFFSLSKAYDLYNYLLLLIVELTRYARKRIDAGKTHLAPTKEELHPNLKFAGNKFAAQLGGNKQLADFVKKQKRNWDNDQDFIKSLYDQIIGSDIYKEYMASEAAPAYEADRELWRKIYKTFIANNESLEQLLEDQSLYWNDDKDIVDTFVLKTIKRFEEKNGANQPLLPEFKDEEDREFASRLFKRSILNDEYYRHLIGLNTKNWDLDRVAFMDVIIMQCALAEIVSFPNIPINVSLNEYVEIAKTYSTPKSGSFINGTLDGIVNQLKNEEKLIKNQ